MVLRNPSASATATATMIHLVFFLSFFIRIPWSLGSNTISGNQTLSGNQTIVSSGQNFELGFFNLGTPPRYYIGIWYKNVSLRTIVWVANRDAPVFDQNSSSLKILDGNLVLVNGSQSQIVWSTNLTSSPSTVVALLRDDGNLVLLSGSNLNSTQPPLWESFNNVADTWLPGGRLAFNKKTQKKQLLISWKNSEDPAPGLFSLELDPVKSQYIIRWNRSQEYWKSGPWNGHIFSDVPEMRLNYIYNFSYVNNSEESYFTYSLYDTSTISRFIMDVSGQIKQVSWILNSSWNLFWSQPRQQCEVYAYCGSFSSCNQNSQPFCNCLPGFNPMSRHDWNLNDYSGGCVREANLQCDRGDKFYPMNYVRLPDNPQRLTVGSIGECNSGCLNNCSCAAYAYDDDAGCSAWYGERGMLNLQQLTEGDGSGRTIYIRLSASSSVFSGGKDKKGLIIGVSLGSVAAILVAIVAAAIIVFRSRSTTVGSVEGSLVAFGYRDLQNATRNFSERLGGGGFGSVFKGSLPDSTVIAVKKLESISQGEKQFRTEVSTLGTIQHVNLVRLRGFCSQGNRKLLVYEYMENGSLDSHLFNAPPPPPHLPNRVLNWKTRYEIALGVARGLSYLHEKCRDCIIHCDIKPENILLDGDLCPKVTDFGLAKLMGRDFSRVLTSMRGTRGYLAPEWISQVAITAKADVYSYGMMLFELVSGRRNSQNDSQDGKVRFFPSLAARVMLDGGDLLSLLDPAANVNVDVEEVLKICKIGCWCIQDDENMRPSMGQVVQILEGLMDVNLPPVPRSLQVFVQSQEEEHIVFFTDSSSTDQSIQTTDASSHSKSKITSNSSN